jgi:cell division septal protein FtsQ
MELRFGMEQFDKKLNRFKALCSNLGERAGQLTLVDLANPDQAVVKGLRKVDAG